MIDLCVVGAGMAGLAAAHHARGAGARVLVLEAGYRPGGRVRTVHPQWAGGRPVECGPEFVDASHQLVRDACARARVTLRPATGELWSHRGGVLAPASDHPRTDPAEARLQHRYAEHMDQLVTALADADRPNDHPAAAELDARSATALFDEVAALADAPPHARAQLGRFVQGTLGAEADQVSALFLVQQAALTSGGGARVVEGLRAVVEHLATTLGPGGEVRYGRRVKALTDHADAVHVHTSHGETIAARGVVLAVPLPALAHLTVPDPWTSAARELRYGSVVKAAVAAPGVVLPGWAVATDLPTGLAWQAQPGIVTTYAGAGRADALAARAPQAVLEQAATDVAAITGRAVAPVGGVWRFTPGSRRGGCYVVFGPRQVGRHWDVLRDRIGRLALAGEHCGRHTGYLEGAMEAGIRAATQLMA